MIIVNFPEDKRVVTTEPVYEWDYGRQLKIVSEKTSIISEVHFCDRSCENAIVRIGTLQDGALVVTIPDALLENEYDINVFLYACTGTSGKTLKQIKIPVIKRKKPENFADPLTPTEEQLLGQAVKEITSEVNRLSQLYTASKTYAEFKAMIEAIIDEHIPEQSIPTNKEMKAATIQFTGNVSTESEGIIKTGVITDPEITANTFVEIFPTGLLERTTLSYLREVAVEEGKITLKINLQNTADDVNVDVIYWINKNTTQPLAAFVHNQRFSR